MKQQGNFKLITTKTTFTISIIVALLTIISIWLFGLGTNRSMFFNSILSTSIISIAFFLFITIGLFKGIKLKDNIGEFTDRIKNNNHLYQQTDQSDSSYLAADIPSILPDFDDGEGAGIFISILLWIGYSIILTIIFWIFGTILWTGIIIFIAILYWIFFRALRLIFKNSNRCKGNLISSVLYGISYTILYNCWIYGIIITTHYL